MRTFKYFISYYKPYLKIFFIDLFCALTISVVDISFPLILHYCAYTLFYQQEQVILHSLIWLGFILLLIYIIRSLCRYYVSAQGHIMGAHMEANMRRDIFDQYQKMSFAYYDKNNTGVMMSKVVSDLFDISEFAHHGPENLFISAVKIIGSFIIMASIYWPLAFVLAIVTMLMLLFSLSQYRKMQETFADNRHKIGLVNASLQDSLSGIRVVKSFGNEEIERQKFAHSNENFLESKRRNYYAMGTFQAGNHFFQGMLYVTLILVGGYFVVQGHLSPIVLATFALYINVFVSPLQVLIELTEMVQKGMSGFKRFEEVMREIPDIQDDKNAIELKDVQGDIVFENVFFQYNDKEEVLTNADFHVKQGKRIALVGPSGGGKTTICSLLSRFYDVTSGKITIDGYDIRHVTLQSLRLAIGLVQQDVYLFNGTIAENIAYGKINATMEEIIVAAKKAHLDEFIHSLPDGYQTWVGERGTRLSGGQKQRISIARVFLKNPKILILDEATSALDNESERVVQKSLESLSEGRTCITIAHRLSTIRNADEILVVDNGELRERGNHDELMALNGMYAHYYQLQFGDNFR